MDPQFLPFLTVLWNTPCSNKVSKVNRVQEVMTPPYPLLWLRYSAFIPLYPLGVASELTMASLALPVIGVKRPLTLDMPNALNWGFDYYYFCWAAIACYLPGVAF